MESIRTRAINWWTNLSYQEKDFNYLLFGYLKLPERNISSLTGKEIEYIYLNKNKTL